jgi:hypothetical protein
MILEVPQRYLALVSRGKNREVEPDPRLLSPTGNVTAAHGIPVGRGQSQARGFHVRERKSLSELFLRHSKRLCLPIVRENLWQ